MITGLPVYALVIGLIAGAAGGAWVMNQRGVAELGTCQREASEAATRTSEQARRAIDTVRRSEVTSGERQAEINEALAADRRAIADALAAGSVRHDSPAASPRSDIRVPPPAAAAPGCDRAGPEWVLGAIEAEADADAALADDTAARLRACYARAREDRRLINRSDCQSQTCSSD